MIFCLFELISLGDIGLEPNKSSTHYMNIYNIIHAKKMKLKIK